MSTVGFPSHWYVPYIRFFSSTADLLCSQRVKLKTIQLDKDTVLLQRMERLVQSHVEMYIEEKDSGVEC